MEPPSENQTRCPGESFVQQFTSWRIAPEIRDQEAEIEALLRDLLEGSYDPRVESAKRRKQTTIGWAFVAILLLLSVFTFYLLDLKISS